MKKQNEDSVKDQNATCDNALLPVVFLSNYIPYGLQGVEYKDGSKYTLSEIRYYAEPVGYWENNQEIDKKSRWCKPILKPLSFLTKDENFDLYMDLCEEIGVVRCEHLLLALQDNLKYAFNLQQLNVLETWLNKNHFDWKYNLIEKGLAFSIYDVV